MAQDPRFGFDDATAYHAEKPRGSALRSCLIGCLWTAAVLTIVAVLAVVWFFTRGQQWVVNKGAQAIKQSIEAADLPAAEKDELGAQIDRIASAFREGRLSLEQVGK